MPSKATYELSSLHLVCQQVLRAQLSCKVACLSIPQGEITQKNLLHILHTVLNKGQREACSWSKVELSLHGLHRGIPHCIPLRWHVGESTPLSEWFMNGYRPRCGSVDAGSLKGGRRLCIKGRSWKVQHQGRLTIFTSIAPCGRHFKDTSSLKTWARTFMCCRIYSLHYPHFMWFSFPQQSGRPRPLQNNTLVFTWCEICAPHYTEVLFGSGWSVFCFFFRCFYWRIVFFSGMVPESQSQVEEEGAFWSDAAGPDTLLYCIRAAPTDSAWELCTGKENK